MERFHIFSTGDVFSKVLRETESFEYQKTRMEDNEDAKSIFHMGRVRFIVYCVSSSSFFSLTQFLAAFQQVATTEDQQHQNSFCEVGM